MIQSISFYTNPFFPTGEFILSKARNCLPSADTLVRVAKIASIIGTGYMAYQTPEIAAFLPSFPSVIQLAATAGIIGILYFRQIGFTLNEGTKISTSFIRHLAGGFPSSIVEAADDQNILAIKLLLLFGTDINEKDSDGNTPLHIASRRGNTSIIRLLMEYGANIHAKNGYAETPLHTACKKRKGNAAVRLLLDNGANINETNDGRETPLHKASKFANIGKISTLLAKQADIHARDSNEDTPLHNASKWGTALTVNILIEKGADTSAKNNLGNTPLHYASARNAALTISILMQSGADITAKNHQGDTPLSYLVNRQPPLHPNEWTIIEENLNLLIQNVNDQCRAFYDSSQIPLELIYTHIREYLLGGLLRDDHLFLNEKGRIQIKRL